MAYFKGKKTITVNLNTDVIANPELTGDEAELTGLQVSNVKYAITQVEANPTLAGTEADLTGLQIGDTKYAIPSGGGGGGSLYEHNIVTISNSPAAYIGMRIINSNPNAMTLSDIKTLLQDNGFNSAAKSIPSFGAIYSTSRSTWEQIFGIYLLPSNQVVAANVYTNTLSFAYIDAYLSSLVDTVVQIM